MNRFAPPPAPPAQASPLEAALRAMARGKARARRRAIRAAAHAYERGVLRAWLGLPEAWFHEKAAADPVIARAVTLRLKCALSRERRLRGPFLGRAVAAPLDRETRLWGLLGGEFLAQGRHVKTPEEIP